MYIETQGDAVGHPDAPLQPVSEVTGRVAFTLPLIGYLLYMLTVPTGMLSILSLGMTILLAIRLLEEIEVDGGSVLDAYESELALTLDAQRTREFAG